MKKYLSYVLLCSEVFLANNAVIDTSFNAPSLALNFIDIDAISSYD